MSEKFTPAFGMSNKHIQTLFASFFRNKPQPKTLQERLHLKDGDFLDLNWCYTHNSNPNTPIVILFHGLAGSVKSPYIRGMMDKLSKNGLNTVLMHFRSCSGEINTLPRAYHSGETGDALYCIETIQKRFTCAPLYAIGYSLGGNMLLKLLGELGDDSPLNAAVSVSAPMQLHISSEVISKGFSRLYQKHLIAGITNTLKKKYSQHDMQSLLNFKEENINTIKTFFEYDSIYTAPIHGFDSANDYYTKCSAKQYLKDIHTPTLIIHASDDPFMDDRVLPSKEEISSSVFLEVSKNGGHVGFVEGSLFKPKYWLEERIVKFFTLNK